MILWIILIWLGMGICFIIGSFFGAMAVRQQIVRDLNLNNEFISDELLFPEESRN